MRTTIKATQSPRTEPERVGDDRGPGPHAGPSRLDPRRLLRPEVGLAVCVVAIIAYLALVPLLYLIWGTVWDGTSLTSAFFAEAYSDIPFATLIGNTVVFASGSTALSVTIAVTLAYLVVRTDVPFKPVIFSAALVPLVIPTVLYTSCWIFLASGNIGLLNSWSEALSGRALFNVFSMPGMIVVDAFNAVPLGFLIMYAGFKNMDPSLEESALMSGAGKLSVFFRITLPLVRPATYAALLILGIKALESFEVPTLLGMPSGIWLFTSRTWWALRGTFPPNFGQAGAYAVPLILLCTLGIFFYSRLSRRSKALQTVTGKAFRPRPIQLGGYRWVAFGVVAGYLFVAVVLPLFILVYLSTQPFYSAPGFQSLSRFTMDNYAFVFNHYQTARALRNSLTLAVSAATIVLFITTIAGWLIVRTKLRGRWVIDNLAFLPLTIPGIILGVALIFVYLRHPLPVYGTLWILLIAYVTHYMPYGMRFAQTSLFQISNELEESALTSGATWWEMIRKVTIPLIAPGLMTGWIYIVLIAVRELSSSILLYAPGTEILSIVIWEQLTEGRYTELSALGVLMILLLVSIAAAAYRVGSRAGVQAGEVG